MLVPAAQTRQLFQQLLRVPDLQVFGVQPNLDYFADQSARHRVVIPLDVDQAARVHSTTQPLERLQPPRRQWLQHRPFFCQPLLTAGVEPAEHLPQKLLVLGTAGEVPAATQH